MVTNDNEAVKARMKIFELEQEVKKVREPLVKYNKECDLKYRKEKWEHKTFHSPLNGGTFIYVTEVNAYDVKCFTFKSWNFGDQLTEISLNRSFSYEEMVGVSEWIGIGQSFYGEMETLLMKLKTHLIDDNKSIKL
tara:strand:- start:10784 stop:11191 length:408 start_codon:yes stop_codon:yes gene_type:complete